MTKLQDIFDRLFVKIPKGTKQDYKRRLDKIVFEDLISNGEYMYDVYNNRHITLSKEGRQQLKMISKEFNLIGNAAFKKKNFLILFFNIYI